MNLNALDWSIVIAIWIGLIWLAWYTNRYTKCVSSFLSANRCAGRYLLTMAEGSAALGAITVIGEFEKFYTAGFAATWWTAMVSPIGLVIALSGWIAYRYRETRAMTMAQFFEIRYSRKFRVFTGLLAWFAGVLNYGIFPAITARFFIHFCGFPEHMVALGPLELNVTMGIIMAFMLTLAVLIVFQGGQISVMITDFIQGQLIFIIFIVVSLFLLFKVGWGNITDALMHAPPGKSMINPFEQQKIGDFTFMFFVMWGFRHFYGFMAWQGGQGYYSSALSAHEARMSRILGQWRSVIIYFLFLLIPISMYAFLNGDAMPEQAAQVQQAIGQIDDAQVQKQMTVPVAISALLPHGMIGLFCAVIFAAAVSTDDTYLHSWGSIFIQDVVMPLRAGKPKLSQEAHIWLLRWSIIGVAIFAWLFSMLFPLKEYIIMWFQITGAIYVGGAGVAIIGGLYWKRGTTAGAWSGMIMGSVLATGGILLKNILWPYVLPGLQENYPHSAWLINLPEKFPLDGMEMFFISAITSICTYVTVSLCTKVDPSFDMDRMLHRGKYAPDDTAEEPRKFNILKLLGIGKEFSRTDKMIYFWVMGFTMFWFLAFIVGTIIHFTIGTSNAGWMKWWEFRVWVILVVGIITVCWFVAGGVVNIKQLFARLKDYQPDERDDGSVVGHHLADEEDDPEAQASTTPNEKG